MIPDPKEHTVKIPAQWRDGKWQLFGGGDLPKFKDGAIVDFVFPAIFLAEPEDVERWTKEIRVPFLPKATELLIRVNSEKVPDNLLKHTVEIPDRTGRLRRFVKVLLESDLSISLVPGKKGQLDECPCSIPAIKQTAESVNEAYKKIAIEFEPNRRSNSGNIFLLAFIERDGRLIKLDKIRDELPGRVLELKERRAKEEALRGNAPAAGQKDLFEREEVK